MTRIVAEEIREWMLGLRSCDEAEEVAHNGTAAAYGGGYAFTVTLGGEDYHVEIIGPYVEDDEESDDDV